MKGANELATFIRSRGVALTPRGKQLVGLCPFHDDHEPSLVVDAPDDKKATQGCPYGFWNDPTRECRCSPLRMQRYVDRISGPLLDRIDIHIDVPAVKFRELAGDTHSETDRSATIRSRVIAARERQLKRFRGIRSFPTLR